ncbi:MAG: hypothetical protein ACXIUV_11400 [Alkalilacustris sp.]
MRGELLAWRDRLAKASPRQADYAIAILARVLSWAHDRGLAPDNPLQRPGRIYRADRTERIWSDADEAAFMAAAPAHLRLAFLPAADTGQRQGDLIRLPWSTYDGARLLVRQGKTRRRVVVPVKAGEMLVGLFEVYARENPNRVKADTLNQARRDVATFFDCAGGSVGIAALTKQTVREWKAMLQLYPVKARLCPRWWCRRRPRAEPLA